MTGIELYLFQLAGYAFIENIYDYIFFLLDILIVVWVVLLFIWSLKSKPVQFYMVIPISVLAIVSSFIWYFQF